MASMLAKRLQESSARIRSDQGPKIFISHQHRDEVIARALVSLLEAALQVDSKRDIRCTSLDDYGLQGGVSTSNVLRAEISGAQAVIGLIGPLNESSPYVFFELGAAWGGRHEKTLPVLIRGATPNDLPGPLKERNALDLARPHSCLRMVRDLSSMTRLQPAELDPERLNDLAKALAVVSRES
jgi:hypothetical protein